MAPKVPRTPAKKEEDERSAELDGLIHVRDEELENLQELQAELADVAQADRRASDVRSHLKELERISNVFGSLHQRIVVLTDTRGPHDAKRKEFRKVHSQVSKTLERWMDDLTPAAATAGPFTALQTARQAPVVIQQPLPRIIPKFDGKYENWERFKIMFKDIVDRSNESARIKLYHLDDALIGEAAGAIDDKTIQDGNYDYAWQLLEENYGDKRRMIEAHIGGLLGVPKLTEESHTELRSLVENFSGHVENLKFLGQEFSGVSEQIAVYILAHALDEGTYKLWEATVKRGELPKYDEAIKFLKGRVSVLERWEATKKAAPKQREQSSHLTSVSEQPYYIANTAVTSQPGVRCDICNESHLTFRCTTFNGLTVHQRMVVVRERNLCNNCLRSGHHWKECGSQHSCRKCQRRHNTLLHRPMSRISGQKRTQSSPAPCNKPPAATAMLPTALVTLRDNANQPVPCRVLMDSGSQVNFISESMADHLNLQRKAANVHICGIGAVKTFANDSVTINLQSRVSNFSANVECLIVPKVTGMVPAATVAINEWPIPVGIQLADPAFHKPDSIDMLLGVTMFFRLLKTGQIELECNQPDLRETHLGWIIAGHGSVHDDLQPQYPVNVGMAIC